MARHGLVLGKFLPPHAGHHELVDFALERCERVTVLVLGAAAEPIPLALRRDWMRERHPRARVVAGWDELPVDFDDPHVHDLHIAVMERLLTQPREDPRSDLQAVAACRGRQPAGAATAIDAVFTGEAYGDLLAQRWGVEHVRLQRGGDISGTQVRADPAAFWSRLEPGVRAYLCRRVVITGAESTGTTTLAAALAERLGTLWVPEVGRAVSEARGLPYVWTDTDFEMIDRRQQRDEDRAARASGPVLVCDTDALATCIWQERYMGRSTGPVEAIAASRSYALSVLTSDDIPFVQDGLRDGEHLRGWMTERLRDPWIEVRGSVEERVDQVLSALRGCSAARSSRAPGPPCA